MLRDAVKMDRARIQIGRLSRFGLLELSRQRLRPALGETTHIDCPRCSGMGTIRGVESMALALLRLIGEEARKERTGRVMAQVPVDVATYLINEKREWLNQIEARDKVSLVIVPNPHMQTPAYSLRRIRDDEKELPENTSVSYQIAEQPALDDSDIGTRDKKPQGEAPLVPSILPVEASLLPPLPLAPTATRRRPRPPQPPRSAPLRSSACSCVCGASCSAVRPVRAPPLRPASAARKRECSAHREATPGTLPRRRARPGARPAPRGRDREGGRDGPREARARGVGRAARANGPKRAGARHRSGAGATPARRTPARSEGPCRWARGPPRTAAPEATRPRGGSPERSVIARRGRAATEPQATRAGGKRTGAQGRRRRRGRAESARE